LGNVLFKCKADIIMVNMSMTGLYCWRQLLL
jgi:hypothetical protein